MEKQDEALRQLENVTKAQNEKIAALNELNENLQQEFENHDLEIDMMLNASSDQKEQLENLSAELQNSDSLLQQKIENVSVCMCVHMCVCMCVCACVCLHVRVSVCACLCLCVRLGLQGH